MPFIESMYVPCTGVDNMYHIYLYIYICLIYTCTYHIVYTVYDMIYSMKAPGVRQHGHELMTLTLDVNQAHTAVGSLRKELVPEIEKKVDQKSVELDFLKVTD